MSDISIPFVWEKNCCSLNVTHVKTRHNFAGENGYMYVSFFDQHNHIISGKFQEKCLTYDFI